MAELRWASATDSGKIRDANEDAFVAEAMVFVVADGMGGHQAGEVASALAVSTLRERLHAGATSIDVVVAAVVEANAAIFQTAHVNASQRGMGTTLVALSVLPANDARPEQFAVINVGDSRVYVVRNGELIRITVDHNYVQELLATGHITEAEARNHPRRNIVTRALGIEPSVRVDSWVVPIVRGDRYLLCSDGLVDEVDDGEILEIITANGEPQQAADALTTAALDHGGRDNVTIVVVDVLEGMSLDELAAIAAESGGDDATVILERLTSEIESDPPTEEIPITPAKKPPRLTRQLTAKMFLVMLLAAVALTVVVTLIAVAVSNDDAPTPTPTTVVTTTPTTTRSTSTTTSVEPTTTTRPATTTRRSSPIGNTTLP